MSEADDLGALVLGLAERSINEYHAKPFPEDRDPIVHYFTLLDNLVDATDSPYHFYRGIPLLKTISSTQASYFLHQEREHGSMGKPFGIALGTTLCSATLVGLGLLSQSVPLVYGGLSGVAAGCVGLAYTLGRGRRAETSTILKNHAHILNTGELSWTTAFREYAPEIRCLVERFKREYAQEHTDSH